MITAGEILHTKSKLFAFKFWIVAFTLVFMYVVSCSFFSPPPLQAADVVVFVNHTKSGLILTEVRKYIGFRDEVVNTYQYLYEESNPSNFFVLHGGDFEVRVGEFPVLNTVVLPEWVRGRWCSSVTHGWWPSWSQRAFNMKTKDVCFETSEYE